MDKDIELSIVIPAYNEQDRIGKTLLKLLGYLETKMLKAEVIVVNDGSTDRTKMMLKRFDKRIRIVNLSENKGKGFAVKTGVLHSRGRYILFMDADLATPLYEIKNFLDIIRKDKKAQILIGWRKGSHLPVKRTLLRQTVSLIFNQIKSLLVPTNHADTQCGFKLFKREIAREIFQRTKINRYAFDMEVLYLAAKLEAKTYDIPVDWEEKGGSRVRLIRDSLRMLKDMFLIRFYLTFNYYFLDKKLADGSFDGLFSHEAAKEVKKL